MPKKRGTYKEETLQKALLEIREKLITKKKASRIYNIPRSTLIFRLGQTTQKPELGPPTILTTSEEHAIAEWLIACQKKGFPQRKEDVFDCVKEFIDADQRITPFKNNTPGRGWFNSFLKRNPNVAIRVPDPVTTASARVSASDIERWFNSVIIYLNDSNNLNILESPERVYNGDETNFLLCPKTRSVLAAKGARNIYEIDRGAPKSNLTVMCTFSASGETVLPMIIYPYKRVPEDIRKSVPQSWALAISENGWMTKEVFYEYISKHFYPYLISQKIKFPVIYFVDGHSTHMTLKVSELCVRLGIIIIALYPNATRILQPCDYAVFKPLKNSWTKMVHKWRKENSGASFTREKFAPLLLKAFDTCITPQIIANGFKACGLFPWDFTAIDFSKCLGKSSNNFVSNTIPLDGSINYEKFSEIVGDLKIRIFEDVLKNPQTLKQYDENFELLFQLFMTIKGLTISETFESATQVLVPNQHHSCENDDHQMTTMFDINEINDFVYVDESITNPFCDPKTLHNFDEYSVSEEVVITLGEELTITKTSIENYLDWPITPVKTGTPAMKPAKPFVITSPMWIEAQRERKLEKDKQILEKENRKAVRLEKMRMKKEESALKCLIKKEKLMDKNSKTKQPKRRFNKKARQTIQTSPKIETIIYYSDAGNYNSTTNNKEIETISLVLETEANQQISLVELNNAACEFPVADDYSPVEEEVLHLNNSTLMKIGDNQIAKGSMCYHCTFSFSKIHGLENVGIKCNKCLRELHVKCIGFLKLQLLPLFLCGKCNILSGEL